MTTAKLVKMIQDADPSGKRTVYLQHDPEGNGYSPANAMWRAAVNSHGDVGLDELTASDRKRGFTEGDVVKGKKIVVIVPRH